jgi:hypothetical protein
MTELTTAMLAPACRIFLNYSYPEGPDTIPLAKKPYFEMASHVGLDSYLAPPLCQSLRTREGALKGYAFRLGSAVYPHLKLQLVTPDGGKSWIFSVDTHDACPCSTDHADYEPWRKLQEQNRRLKEQIERAWEERGLLTFNGLLRRGLRPTSKGQDVRC